MIDDIRDAAQETADLAIDLNPNGGDDYEALMEVAGRLCRVADELAAAILGA